MESMEEMRERQRQYTMAFVPAFLISMFATPIILVILLGFSSCQKEQKTTTNKRNCSSQNN